VKDEERRIPPTAGDERSTLTGLLDFQRDTLEWKCTGLTADQLRQRSVPPSDLSLLGLLRHLAKVERGWFGYVLAGERDQPPAWEEDPAGSFEVTGSDAAEAMAAWRDACARSTAFVTAAPSLDVAGTYRDETFSLRYVLIHLIEEYSRHNGHADLIRERIDGSTGE
jgi:uncharacterized damage-inducible protein DinB